jgi:hypothetical protein
MLSTALAEVGRVGGLSFAALTVSPATAHMGMAQLLAGGPNHVVRA